MKAGSVRSSPGSEKLIVNAGREGTTGIGRDGIGGTNPGTVKSRPGMPRFGSWNIGSVGSDGIGSDGIGGRNAGNVKSHTQETFENLPVMLAFAVAVAATNAATAPAVGGTVAPATVARTVSSAVR